MTKLFKNDLFLPHDSVVKAGSGAQFCVDIHGFEGGWGSSHFNYIPGYKIVHTSCTCTIMKKITGGGSRPHITSLWVLYCLVGRDNTGSKKFLWDFSSMRDNSI